MNFIQSIYKNQHKSRKYIHVLTLSLLIVYFWKCIKFDTCVSTKNSKIFLLKLIHCLDKIEGRHLEVRLLTLSLRRTINVSHLSAIIRQI